MQHATDPARRPPRPLLGHASAINAANDIASTNSTFNRFLGTNQRSWMSSTKPLTATPPIGPPPLPPTRPLPPYRFLSAVPETAPGDATRNNPDAGGQHGEPSGSSLEQLPQEPGNAPRPATTGPSTIPQHDLAVVDLTLSQPDEHPHQHGPMQSKHALQPLANINTTTASDLSASAASQTRPQLLTPAASPLIQYNGQLHRKRPSLDASSLQYTQSRLRTESPTVSPVTRRLPPTTTWSDSTPQDQGARQQPPAFVPPPQPVHSQSIPQQPLSASPAPGTQPVHSIGNLSNGSGPLPLQPYSASTIGMNAPLLGRGQSYLATFDSAIAEMSTRIDLSNRPQLRLPWIRDACENNDLFFLLLNQLLCMWHLSKELLIPLGMDTTCDAGFKVLELLFASNSDFPKELLAFLAGWPNSTYSLKANAELNQWVVNTGQFLPQLGRHWDRFRQLCIQRRCPPTAREITNAFKCPPSAILPRAIFTSLGRQTAPGYPPEFHNAAYQLFRVNQNDYFAAIFSHRVDTSLAQDYTAFATQYGHLLQQHWRRVSGAGVPSPRPPSLPALGVAQSRNPQLSFTSSSQRNLPGLATAPQNAQNSNQDLINSVATGGAAPSPVNPLPADVAAQHVRTSTGSGSGVLNNSNQTSSAVLPLSNSMGPIQNHSARTNVQSLSTAASLTSSASHRTNQTQPGRTQIFRPNLPSPPAQLLLPDLRHLPPLLTNPLPEQEALHLAHLRQPQTEVKDVRPGETPRLYQSVQSLVLGPHPFTPGMAFFETSFELLPDVVGKKAEIIQPPTGSFKLPKRILSTDSLLFNLRCIQLKTGQELPDESDWAALPTYYPQHIFISINDEYLEIRRKRQFRRDLPIDVTPFVRAGENKVTVSIHGGKNEEGKTFALGVEVIGLQDHSQALKIPTKIVFEEALKSIISSMQPATGGDDDELEVVTDSITLSVTDPFLSSMFTIPVRGKRCKHRECFDLETFLRSRVSDNKDALISVYEWRCPICGKDARPKSLVIDGFMQQVRDRLVKAGNTDARAIVIKKDGSWKLKQEADREASHDASRGSSKQPGKNHQKGEGRSFVALDQSAVMPPATDSAAITSENAPPTASRVIEIIELDDD